jgi:hypothetical protein
MKHLKHFKIFEKYVEKTLYHGGLEGFYEEETGKNLFNKFDKFKPRTAYFSDNPKFAADYADRKTSEGAYDADKWLYTCKFKGNLFEYDNPDDMKKLIQLIPDEVDVSHGVMWFMTAKIKKEDMIKALQGIDVIEPRKEFVEANIGDKVPNPTYEKEKFIVVNKDDKYVYTISENSFNDYLTSSKLGYNKNWSYYTKFKDIFEPWRNQIVDTYNKNTESNYSYPKYSFENFYHTYSYSKNGYNIDYVSYKNDNKIAFTKEDHKRIDDLYDICYKNFKETIFE